MDEQEESTDYFELLKDNQEFFTQYKKRWALEFRARNPDVGGSDEVVSNDVLKNDFLF